MAELLIFSKDVQGDDTYHTVKLPKRGYVITIQDDGWNWGSEELKNPIFRIIKLPGAAISDLTSFLSWEAPTDPNTDPVSTSNTYQMRGFKFDMGNPNLPSALLNYFNDAGRATAFFDCSTLPSTQPSTTKGTATGDWTASDAISFKVQNPAVADPNTFGTSPSTF